MVISGHFSWISYCIPICNKFQVFSISSTNIREDHSQISPNCVSVELLLSCRVYEMSLPKRSFYARLFCSSIITTNSNISNRIKTETPTNLKHLQNWAGPISIKPWGRPLCTEKFHKLIINLMNEI